MVHIRDYEPKDLDALLEINRASTPGVSEESRESLGEWLRVASLALVAHGEHGALGFITLMRLGTLAYPSPNLRWFEAHTESLIYVDRIAIAASARGLGLGEELYRATFERCAGEFRQIGCEVNRQPPNPGSLRFHERLGFQALGSQVFEAGVKEVIYLARPLAQSGFSPDA